MNILIITPFYKQDRNIASVRWTNISQRLAKKHHIIVVTQPLDDDMDMTFTKKEEDGILVARLNQKTTYEKIAVKLFHGATGNDWQTTNKTNSAETAAAHESFVRKAKNTMLYASMQTKATSYAKKICADVISRGMKIDVVISSACPFIEMLFGYEVKKRLGCKWISDFRDLPFIDEGSNDAQRMKSIMVRYLKEADAVVTIAPKGKEFLAEHGIVEAEKIHVITNGFSRSDAQQPVTINDGILHLVHTGSLYGGRRKPDLLFRAIHEIKQENPGLKFLFEVAGGNNSFLLESARNFQIEDQIIDHGFLQRKDALALQNRADCLVALVENMPGSLSAKLFEYTLCKKPVIAITCGIKINSDATHFIKQCNIGTAVEEGKMESDYLALKEYLIMQATRKRDRKPLLYSPNIEALRKYDIDTITNEIEKLCFIK